MNSKSWSFASALSICLAAVPAVAQSEIQATTAAEATPDRAEQFRKRAAESAGQYVIKSGEDGQRQLQLYPVPVQQWSNPVNERKTKGDLFLFTDRGRPEVILSIYEMMDPSLTYFYEDREFASLSLDTVIANGPGHPEWRTVQPGVVLKPLADAPAPSDKRALRLTQMRLLARRFTADKTTRSEVTRELRLLTQPIYRYEGDHPDVVDAALFAFVEGTDPEALLLLEARRSADGPRWMFALARMNSIELRAYDQGEQVWHAERFDAGGDVGRVYEVFRIEE